MAKEKINISLPYDSKLTLVERDAEDPVEDSPMDLDDVLSTAEGDPVDLCTIMDMNEFMQGRS